MNTFTEENYLKAIYKLSEFSQDGVSTNAIAEKLNTKAGSVTDMLKKLSDKSLIHYQKYQGVNLTEEGRKVAIDIIRKHRLWEYFLVDKLHFKWDEIHHLAEELEHIHSEELIDRLDKFLGFPRFDPHGDPIPDKEGKIHRRKNRLLSLLSAGETGTMTGVINHSTPFLQYLEKLNLHLGTKIEVIEIAGFDKSMHLKLNDKQEKHISYEVASNIHISDL